ncbi:unnamed protein product [Acidithrix sp. C25]|nr:unnamed protein product [Acidithrix sp. C25]
MIGNRFLAILTLGVEILTLKPATISQQKRPLANRTEVSKGKRFDHNVINTALASVFFNKFTKSQIERGRSALNIL